MMSLNTVALKSLTTLASALTLFLPVAALTSQPASAEDLHFTLENHTSSTLEEFYLVPDYSGSWGEDILFFDVVPGQSGTILVTDGLSTCTYDILAEFSDGGYEVEHDVNLCELGSYTFTD